MHSASLYLGNPALSRLSFSPKRGARLRSNIKKRFETQAKHISVVFLVAGTGMPKKLILKNQSVSVFWRLERSWKSKR